MSIEVYTLDSIGYNPSQIYRKISWDIGDGCIIFGTLEDMLDFVQKEYPKTAIKVHYVPRNSN